ncbi:MAG: hypothetical protein ACRD3L_06085 [Terriglobales bacterium]
MSSIATAWHILRLTRVLLSLVLFLVVVRRRIYKDVRLFAIYTGWIALAGTAVMIMNYAPFVSGHQYFAGTTISNGVESVLAFAIIYLMLQEKLGQYPTLGGMGKSAFQAATLLFVVIAIALAWLSPALDKTRWTAIYAVVLRTMRILECGQLAFLFLFSTYFRMSWRNRAFGIALGLGISASTSLAINAINSQIVGTVLNRNYYILLLAGDSTYMLAIVVWLVYVLAAEPAPPRPPSSAPQHDLETWNRELERLLEG